MPISTRSAASLSSAAAIFRFLMQPRDLTHPDACDFLAGNPQELPIPGYVETIQRALTADSPRYFQYGPAWRPAVEAVAAALRERLGLQLGPDDVFLTRGASSGLALALRTFTDPGDEVILLSPPWFFYEALLHGDSVRAVRVPLLEESFDIDLAGVERAITERTAALILNTPHNPSGRVYPDEQLRGLAELLESASARIGRRIHLLSDEAYARILFDGRRMLTPGRFYPATVMLHTYSKTLLAPSQRAGYLAIPPEMPDGLQVRQALTMGSIALGALPDTAMQHAMPELEELSIDMAAIERRRDRLVAELRRLGYSVHVPEGTFYLFPRTPIPDAIEFCEWLSERRVYTLPGEAFERPGYFRLSLTATDEMVERALPALAEAMGTFRPTATPRA